MPAPAYSNTLQKKLLSAASDGRLDEVKELCKKHTGEINIHENNELPLRSAAHAGHLGVVKYLVDEHNANIHAQKEFALCFAAARGHFDIVKYLIEEHDADPSIKKFRALRYAAANGQLDVVKYLVDNHDSDIHAKNGYPIYSAAEKGYLNIVRYILEEHKDKNPVGIRKLIMGSLSRDNTNVVTYLIDTHYLDKIQPNEKSDFLILAAGKSNFELVEYFVKLGTEFSILKNTFPEAYPHAIKAYKELDAKRQKECQDVFNSNVQKVKSHNAPRLKRRPHSSSHI